MVVVGVEEDEVTREVGVHQLEGEGRRQSRKEGSPHHLVREVVGDLERRGVGPTEERVESMRGEGWGQQRGWSQ